MSEQRICEACSEEPAARFWRGGAAWICDKCDTPIGVAMTVEELNAWKLKTIYMVEAGRMYNRLSQKEKP